MRVECGDTSHLWQPDWAMRDDDPLYLRECEWPRRNGMTGYGVIIGREGNSLLIAADDIRATPFKVSESRVTVMRPNVNAKGEGR